MVISDSLYVFVLIWCWISPLFVLCILVGSLGISFDKCCFYSIYLFLNGFFNMFCILYGKPFLFLCLGKVSWPYFLVYINVTHFAFCCWESLYFVSVEQCSFLFWQCYIGCCVECFWWCLLLFLFCLRFQDRCVICLVGN
jgi:hypothetical protein